MIPRQKKRHLPMSCFLYVPGNVLLSHTATRAVPSAMKGLTSVFGMGTGVTLSLLPPGIFSRCDELHIFSHTEYVKKKIIKTAVFFKKKSVPAVIILTSEIPGLKFRTSEHRSAMKIREIILSILLCLILSSYALAGEENTLVAVLPGNTVKAQASASLAEKRILETCSSLGRLFPSGRNRLSQEEKEALLSEDDVRQTAEKLNLSFYIILSVTETSKKLTGTMKCVPLTEDLAAMKAGFSETAEVPADLALKLALQLAGLHRNIPLTAEILPAENGDGTYILKAGQRQGLYSGTLETDSGPMEVLRTASYSSSVKFKGPVSAEKVTISLYPPAEEVEKELIQELEENIQMKYSPDHIKGENPENRFVRGICLVNPCTNLCMPGFGTFLAASYMGFEKPEIYVPGFAAVMTSLSVQLTLTEFMTGFKTNFFPWIQDQHKNGNVLRLQRFLWASIPLTISAGFLDQLAFQEDLHRQLPPFFMYKDMTAASLSLLIPGGGHFYKGNHAAGWIYWTGEMSLAGYGFFHLHSRKAVMAFTGLGLLKAADIIHGFFSVPGYRVYKQEKNLMPVLGFTEGSTEQERIFRAGLLLRM